MAGSEIISPKLNSYLPPELAQQKFYRLMSGRPVSFLKPEKPAEISHLDQSTIDFTILVGNPESYFYNIPSYNITLMDAPSIVLKLIQGLNEETTLPFCSDIAIHMIYGIKINEPSVVDMSPLFSVITDSTIFNSVYSRLLNPELKHALLLQPMSNVDTVRHYITKDLDINKYSFSKFKQHFEECPYPYFYLPVYLTAYILQPPYYEVGHMNGILINKENGTLLRIEPAFNPDTYKSTNEEKIKESIIDIAKKIGVENPKFFEMTEACPQYKINGDMNCVFWSLFISSKIINNIDKSLNPNDVIKFFFSKPAPELQNDIVQFKKQLFDTIIPRGVEKLNILWPEWENFNRRFKDYNGSSRKTKKRKLHRKKNKKRKRRTLRKK